MIATHIDYLRPGFIRVEDRKKVLCVGPQAPLFRALHRPDLPAWPDAEHDARRMFGIGADRSVAA
jgi:hypothetical protein